MWRPRWFAPGLLAAALALSGWFANRGLPTNDEGALLTNAAKLLRGAVFYREIDAYPFPGATYLLALALKLCGERVEVARALAVACFAGMLLALYAAALRVLGPRRAGLFGLALLALKFVAWPAFSAYIYADVAFAFGCAAAALLLGHDYRGPSARLVAAGLCTGLALAAKQNLGIYLAGASGLLLLVPGPLLGGPRDGPRRRAGELAAFAAGMALVLVPAAAYFAAHGLLGQALASGLLRPFSAYAAHSGVSFLPPLRWWELGALRDPAGYAYLMGPYLVLLLGGALPGPAGAWWLAGELASRALYTSIPLIFAVAGLRWLRARRAGPLAPGMRQRALLAVLALAALASAFPRADFYHVASIFPLVLLLLFAERRGARGARAEAAGVGVLLAGAGALSALYLGQMSYRLELERAHLRVSPFASWVESVVRYIDDEVAPDQRLFVYGHEAWYYFLSARFDPWPFAQLYPGMTGGGGGEALVAELSRRPPALIVRGDAGDPPLPRSAPALFRWVSRHYVPVEDVFTRHPPPRGVAPPPALLQVFRPKVPIPAGR